MVFLSTGLRSVEWWVPNLGLSFDLVLSSDMIVTKSLKCYVLMHKIERWTESLKSGSALTYQLMC